MAHGSSDDIGEEEHRQGAKEFTKVGTTDNNLGPSTDAESAFGVSRSEGRLQEPVEVESQGVTGEEPCQAVEQSPDVEGDRKATYR